MRRLTRQLILLWLAPQLPRTRRETAPLVVRGDASSCTGEAGRLRHRARFNDASGTRDIMHIDDQTVRRIARLARIKIDDSDVAGLEKELSGILDWVEQLGEVDTTGVEPMTRVVPIALKQREDVVTDGGIADQIVQNAPVSEDNFFVVPKVIE